MKHSDKRKELDISPFRIYILLRPETEHLVSLFEELNEDPLFTYGVFHIVVLPSSVTNNAIGIVNDLYYEWVNVERSATFRERDVIYRYYGDSFEFGSNHFADPTDYDAVRSALLQISQDLINRAKNGIVEQLKHSSGVLSSCAPRSRSEERSIKKVLFEATKDYGMDNCLEMSKIAADNVAHLAWTGDVIKYLEETYGSIIWESLNEVLRGAGDAEVSDCAIKNFFSTGGIAFPPRVRIEKSKKGDPSITHGRFSITLLNSLGHLPKEVHFQHTDSFAVYVWLLLNPQAIWDYSNRKKADLDKDRIRALVKVLFGYLIADPDKLVETLTKPRERDGKLSYQSLQDAMNHANDDLIRAFELKVPIGRPLRGTPQVTSEQKKAMKEKARVKAMPYLIQNKPGREIGRYIVIPSGNIEICEDFLREYEECLTEMKTKID